MKLWNAEYSTIDKRTDKYVYLYVHVKINGRNTYLLLAECEVRTASYRPSFFASFYGPSENKEGKKRGSITYRTDRADEANKMFIIWLC